MRIRGGRLRRGSAAALVIVLCLAFGLASAEGQTPAETPPASDSVNPQFEYNVKAVFLYSFGRFVEWPSMSFQNANSPFVIGVLGKDPFGAVLDKIANSKKVEGRRIVVLRFATMAEYQPCHILFVAASASPEQKEAAMKMAKSSPVLLVGEETEFTRQGGIVSFFIEENKVRFEINIEVAKRNQLKISSKLLSLAKITEQK